MAERSRLGRKVIQYGSGIALATLLAACGGTEQPGVPPAAVTQGTPEGAGQPGFSPTIAPVENGAPAAPTPTTHPEVQIPRLDLHAHEGIVGLTDAQKVELHNLIQTDPEVTQLYNDTIKNEADRLISEDTQPHPEPQILVSSDNDAETIKHGKTALLDMRYTYKLAMAAIAEPNNTQYADKAKQFILAWARTNHSTGNPINETNFDRMWIAYSNLKESFSDQEREEVLRWIDEVGQKQQDTPFTIGNTARNNWANHKDKLLLMSGVLTGNQARVDEALARYQHQMDSFYNPDGTTFDYAERGALVYSTYGLLPAVDLARVYALNGGADLYHLENTNGGSIAKSVAFLKPYIAGQPHIEFTNTSIQSDRKRADYGKPWDPANAVPVLESAMFFDPSLIQQLSTASGAPVQNRYGTFNGAVYSVQRFKSP